MILNCDTKTFESPFDDVRSLPPEIVSQLKKHLTPGQDHIGDRVSKIFLGALVQLIGGYRDAVEFHDTCKTFNHDKFIESRPSHLRPFLTKMMELQIFAQFVDDRLKMLNSGLGFSDEFELETVRYAEKMKKRGRNAFLKHVKDKVSQSRLSLPITIAITAGVFAIDLTCDNLHTLCNSNIHLFQSTSHSMYALWGHIVHIYISSILYILVWRRSSALS